MKLYTTCNPHTRKRLEVLQNFYDLDTKEVEKENLYSLKNKNILFLDDGILGFLKKMKYPDSNKYHAFHVPKYLLEYSSIQIKIIPDITAIRLANALNKNAKNLNKFKAVPFEEKQNKFLFAGTLTGANEMQHNQRYRFCEIAAKCPRICEVNIVNRIFNEKAPDYEKNKKYLDKIEFSKKISQQEIYSYKYIINIDGNGSRWGTISDLFSNSLMVRQDSSYNLFYEDLLKPFENYIPFSSEYFASTFASIKKFAESNPEKISQIIDTASNLAEEIIERVNTWKI